MSRTTRIVTTAALALGISLSSSVTWAQAQEMDHGRTRPTSRETTVNQVRTYDQVMVATVDKVRG